MGSRSGDDDQLLSGDHPVTQDSESGKTGEKIWSHVWDREYDAAQNRSDIERERNTVRWRKICQRVLQKYGAFSGLKVVEVGAGRGIYSLLMSLEGARAALLDNNQKAFEKARELFAFWGKDFDALETDAFSLSAEHFSKYDIVMSYGLAEHFRYPERLEIFKAHLRLLKPGGFLIVSVPNAAFVPYRIGKFLLERTGKWLLGLEIPFSRSELKQIGQKIGLKNFRVEGSGWVGDFLNFWLTQRLFHGPKYVIEKLLKKDALPLSRRFHYFSFDPPTCLDDFWGYALMLVGENEKNSLNS